MTCITSAVRCRISVFEKEVFDLGVFASRFATPGSFFAFALDARFLVVFSAASFGENAILLDFTVKALECSLKRFVVVDFYFRHQGFPPLVACFRG